MIYFRSGVGALACLALCPLMFAAALPKFVTERFRGPDVQVREVEGIQDRVQAGKLYLNVKDFIALVLKNNTENSRNTNWAALPPSRCWMLRHAWPLWRVH